MVADSVKVKERIVEEDPHEHGIRKALNLGHTFGHAFESWALKRKPILHGHAVAFGMICELYLSATHTGFPTEKMRQTVSFIKEYYGTLPITCDDYDELIELMHHDKKNQNGIINFTLLGGLGTSSSFAVGMLNAFYALKGKYADKKKLADEAIYLERTLCQEAGGWQDQIAASFGGLNRINFRDDEYEVLPVVISPEKKRLLNENLMLYFTGFTRFSSEIQQSTEKSIKDKTAQLLDMLALVDEAQSILTSREGDLDEFGRLLDQSWRLKRQTGSRISTDSIDMLYERALEAGALGGKLLGAGGGGFLLFYVPKEKQPSVSESMSELMHVPFAFENGGTQVIHYTPESYTVM